MGRHYIMWSAEKEERLRAYWKRSGHDRDKFNKLVHADRSIMRHHWDAVYEKCQRMGIFKGAKKSKRYWYDEISSDRQKLFRKLAGDATTSYEDIRKEFDLVTVTQVKNKAHALGIKLVKGPTEIALRRKASVEQSKLDLSETLQSLRRKPDEPEVFQVNEKAWDEGKAIGVRAGWFSRIDYKGPGYRAGIVRLVMEESAKRGCQFNVLNAGIISKDFFKGALPRAYKEYAKEQYLRGIVQEHLIDDAVDQLYEDIPRILKPKSTWRDPKVPEYVRLYIITSPMYDGPRNAELGTTYGEEVARRLTEKRPDDIVLLSEGADRLPVQGSDKLWMALNQVGARLPSEYYSAGIEREIKDKLKQSDRRTPDLVVVGGRASSVIKPAGEKFRMPYLSVPAACRLEGRYIGENQEGMVVVQESHDGQLTTTTINFKDAIHLESQAVTGIKTGATKLHRDIVEYIRVEGKATLGLLHEKIGGDRARIQKGLDFLTVSQYVQRQTWPGLYFDPLSREYKFHLNWFQERHRHRLPAADKLTRESILAFGCLHAGYTTTDYEHFVNEYPRIIMQNNVRTLCGAGDFVAGLAHEMMHRGDIMGSLNYTDQEVLAAELVATVMLKVFHERARLSQGRRLNAVQLAALLEDSLLHFIYIAGNHDTWVEYAGHLPLEKFQDALVHIVTREVTKALQGSGLATNLVSELVARKIQLLEPFDPTCTLPTSGLTLGMRHPSMARAGTSSARAQQVLGVLDTNIVVFANFHVSTCIHEWTPDFGQRVAIEAPTQVIYTAFEGTKLKRLDFGPVLLETLSERDARGKARIAQTTIAHYPNRILQKPRSKSTGVGQLKTELGLYLAK